MIISRLMFLFKGSTWIYLGLSDKSNANILWKCFCPLHHEKGKHKSLWTLSANKQLEKKIGHGSNRFCIVSTFLMAAFCVVYFDQRLECAAPNCWSIFWWQPSAPSYEWSPANGKNQKEKKMCIQAWVIILMYQGYRSTKKIREGTNTKLKKHYPLTVALKFQWNNGWIFVLNFFKRNCLFLNFCGFSNKYLTRQKIDI